MQYIKASNTEKYDNFGRSVAIGGDTLVIGAPIKCGKYRNEGAVYVFRRKNYSWVQEAYLKASNAGENDFFGSSVALDGNTLAVGAPNEDSIAMGINGDQLSNSSPDSGAVYVFRRRGTRWVQEAYIKPYKSSTNNNDRFGWSVALDNDTLAVGAHYEDGSATGINENQSIRLAYDSGAVYVFRRSGSTWSQEAYIKASNTGADDHFGYSVTIDGNTLAVGATGEASNANGINGDQKDNSAKKAGAVYVFRRSGTIWAQEAYIKASNVGAGDEFGYSVAIYGNMLAVGSPYTEIDSKDFAGVVYIFNRNGSTWAQNARIKAFNGGVYDHFGTSLSLSGETLVVGASGEASASNRSNTGWEDNSASRAGVVYVFRQNDEMWEFSDYIKAPNANAHDLFGHNVALDGNTLVVGAIGESSADTGINGDQEDNSAKNAGAVYVQELLP